MFVFVKKWLYSVLPSSLQAALRLLSGRERHQLHYKHLLRYSFMFSYVHLFICSKYKIHMLHMFQMPKTAFKNQIQPQLHYKHLPHFSFTLSYVGMLHKYHYIYNTFIPNTTPTALQASPSYSFTLSYVGICFI